MVRINLPWVAACSPEDQKTFGVASDSSSRLPLAPFESNICVCMTVEAPNRRSIETCRRKYVVALVPAGLEEKSWQLATDTIYISRDTYLSPGHEPDRYATCLLFHAICGSSWLIC